MEYIIGYILCHDLLESLILGSYCRLTSKSWIY